MRSRQLLYAVLSCLITFQAGYAGAEIITTDPAATEVNTVNGVPVIDIAAPSSGGVSHNQFDRFNVGGEGVVINNSTVDGRSALAGDLNANTHFGGNSASIILNEVVTTDRSQLLGTTELFGDNATYILANPNGITCDGCGFIRSPTAPGDTGDTIKDVLLTTGEPTVNPDSVSVGVSGAGAANIVIGPGGLDASQIDATTLLTRQTVINGVMDAADGILRLESGVGEMTVDSVTPADARDFHAGPARDDAVSVAIDASVLGAMTAGQIYIRATEDGVGVTLDNDLMSTTGDIEITAAGDIVYRAATAARPAS